MKQFRYRQLFLLSLLLLLLGSGCADEPETVYTPPSFSGTAYVQAGADHTVILDLASGRLTRIKDGQAVNDLFLDPDRNTLFLLGANGSLARYDLKTARLSGWKEVASSGASLTGGKDGRLMVLDAAGGKILSYDPSTNRVVSEHKVAGGVNNIEFSESRNQLLLLDRQHSRLTMVDPAGMTETAGFAPVGNAIHHAAFPPRSAEIWLAEGNEYKDGKPHGVGYATKGPAAAGGVNVLEPGSGKITDFIYVGGNVVDLVFSPDRRYAFAAASQMPEYQEASLAVIDLAGRRVLKEFRLCDACHAPQDIELPDGRALVKALAIDFRPAGRK